MSARPRSSAAAAAARTAAPFAVYSPHTASAYSVNPTNAPMYLNGPYASSSAHTMAQSPYGYYSARDCYGGAQPQSSYEPYGSYPYAGTSAHSRYSPYASVNPTSWEWSDAYKLLPPVPSKNSQWSAYAGAVPGAMGAGALAGVGYLGAASAYKQFAQ